MNVPRIDGLTASAAVQNEEIAPAETLESHRRHGRLKRALDEARRELVDPSRRNRLLHAPLSGKRPWCMAIVEHNPDELFDTLHRQENFRGYAFRGCDGEEAKDSDRGISLEASQSPLIPGLDQRNQTTIGERISDSAVRCTGRPRLQTSLAHDRLEKRLTKIYREARTLEEEQGISTLFLALGFLKWFDSPQSEEPSFAPLVLVPVSLDRVHGRDGYVLSGRDDDIVVNVSLREKLREFEIALPEIPEGDAWRPSDYFLLVGEAVKRQRRFEVDQTAAGLGFFTFSKFMMWRDLDADVWPNGCLIEHALLRTLLGEGGEFENGPPIASDDEPIDHKIDLSTAIHVMDADSSQAIVIEEATQSRRSLVVQGPPGTGKSQTITNIIAAAVHAGRSVLFIAEKTAALEVVHDRLKRAGLAALCLEIHSRKSNKREVLKSLDEALRLSGSTRFDPAVADRLSACRDKLNRWSSIIHQPIGRSGRTPFDVIGAQLKLRGEKARLLEERLDTVAEWSGENIASAERATDRASDAIAKLQVPPNQHPWYDTELDLQTPFDRDRLAERLTRAANEFDALSKHLGSVFSSIAGRDEPSFADARNIVRALRHIAIAPVGRVALKHPAWVTELTNIETAIAHGQRLSKLAHEVAKQFRQQAWKLDTTTLLLVLRAEGPSFFRKFSGRYRQGLADLRAVCKTKAPKRLKDRIALVEKLQHAQAIRRGFSEKSTLLSAALGPVWNGVQTDWSQAIALLEWTRGALSLLGKERLVELAAHRQDDLGLFSTFADRIETLIQKASKTFTEVGTHVKPQSVAPFGEVNFQDVPIHVLRQLTAAWLANIDKVNDWVSVRNALFSLRTEGLTLIADRLEVGNLHPAEARSAVDLLVAEALWRRATSEIPDLSNIDGQMRGEQVAEFRSLETRRIQICRQEVLSRYLDQKPNGSIGDMGIIRSQIERKRGHYPVRKLIEKAGGAVQRLKPVFLMSPLSVAQFLPPGRMTFDVLVVDEASQVTPEDALGAVARAKQVIVVGEAASTNKLFQNGQCWW